MPGIAGIISKTHPENNQIDIQAMISSMSHELFYNTGTWVNDNLGVYAGWVCHQGSFSDCMPVWNEKKNIVLIYFGENFTDLELFDKLKARHHKFDNSNASYLIHMYEEEGISFLKELNGWFSGVLIDLQNNKIILFNDRYGMQKIFYHENQDAFYFSSEAKALLKVCPELRELDMQGVSEMLSCNCVLENRTLFKDICLLPVSSAWTFQDNKIKKDTYFDPATWENQPWLEKSFFYERLQETFKKILHRYFRANQKIGISLTGGVDTRMIMANMDMPPDKYPCYTFGGMYRNSFDVTISRKIAEATGQTHNNIKLDMNFLKNFSDYAERTIYITDGYLDVSGTPEIYVNRMARDIAPIRLTGNFGGEVMRCLKHLKVGRFNHDLFTPDFNSYSANIKTILENQKKDSDLSFILFVESPWCNNNRLVSEQSQLTLRTPYMDNDFVALLYRLQTDIRRSKAMSLKLISDGNASLVKILTDKGLGGNTIFPITTLTHLYYEFLAKAEYAYDYGMPQWLASIDYAFKFMHFEKLFLGRHKFYHFRLWYRDELSDYVTSILLDERTLSRSYLNRTAVERIVNDHTRGYRNYTTEITQLLTIELIQRQLIENIY